MNSVIPVLYGITHDPTNQEIIARVPRAVKVAIGKPKGPALHVFIATNKEKTGDVWALEIGVGQQTQIRTYPITDRERLIRDYMELRGNGTVPDRKFPEKLPYFSFVREYGDGTLIHDFDSILAHGKRPTAIEIMFTDDRPFRGSYQWWGTKGLVCNGNGLVARRSIFDAKSAEHKELAEEAKAEGSKLYDVDDGCFLTGCQYAGKLCKPHGYLSFQLISDLRIGSKAEIATTSVASIGQLSASIMELLTFTGAGKPENGNIRGLPILLTVKPFRTMHDGKPGKAYKLAVEFRGGKGAASMKAKFLQAAEDFGMMRPAPAQKQLESAKLQIAGPTEDSEDLAVESAPEGSEGESEVDDGITAASNAALFGDGEPEGSAEYVDGETEADPEADDKQRETVAQAAAAELQETEARLRARMASAKSNPQAAQSDEVPVVDATETPVETAPPADDLGASRYESPKEKKKFSLGGKK